MDRKHVMHPKKLPNQRPVFQGVRIIINTPIINTPINTQDAVEKGIFRGPSGAHAGPPKQEYVLRTALEIASAMCYCHGQDILHGDLTGNNVLLVSTNRDPRGFVVKVGGVLFWERLLCVVVVPGMCQVGFGVFYVLVIALPGSYT